jgi:hypothetical protein
MATYAVGPFIAARGVPGEVHDSALNPVGAECEFSVDGVVKKHVYLKGVASTILGSWVTYNQAGETANFATDSAVGPVAVATAAVVANKYGWYGRNGHFVCGAISGGDAAAGARVFATSTDFLPDDVEADDMQVIGAYFVSQEGEANAALGLSATAGLATAHLSDPWFGLAVDASA